MSRPIVVSKTRDGMPRDAGRFGKAVVAQGLPTKLVQGTFNVAIGHSACSRDFLTGGDHVAHPAA
jgi:hypothetical protein